MIHKITKSIPKTLEELNKTRKIMLVRKVRVIYLLNIYKYYVYSFYFMLKTFTAYNINQFFLIISKTIMRCSG